MGFPLLQRQCLGTCFCTDLIKTGEALALRHQLIFDGHNLNEPERLAELLMELAGSDPAIKQRIRLAVANATSPQDMAQSG